MFVNNFFLFVTVNFSLYVIKRDTIDAIIKIEDDTKRNFYMHECINSNWNVRELARQRSTLLYERVYNAKDKNKILNEML